MRQPLAALILLLLGPVAEAGPWAAGRGHLYTKLSYAHLTSRSLAAPDGTIFTIPRFVQDEVGLYAAYGLFDDVTLTAEGLVRSSDLDDAPDELRRETGFGDLRLGAQVQLGRTANWVFAARGEVRAPTGDVTRGHGLQPTGSGVWEGQLRVGAGTSLARGKGYAFLEVGYHGRGGGLRDGLVWESQIGWNAGKRLVLAANFRGVQPFESAPGERPALSLVGLGDGVAYAAYGPTLILRLGGGIGVQADVDGAFHTRNLAEGTVLRVGLFYTR